MIYTGYFAKLKEYKKNGLIPISITRFPPKWFEGEQCQDLAPSAELLKKYKDMYMDEEHFEIHYNEMLSQIDVLKIVEEAVKGRDVVLCCFEKSDDFCHRHLLAKWLNEKYGMNVQEFK